MKNIRIDKSENISKALQQMNDNDVKLLIVTKNDKYYSMLSIGDIQRAILKSFDLQTNIGDIVRKNVKVAKNTDSYDIIKKQMFDYRIEFMPVIRF